jgi:dihydrofolate reductase
MTTIALVVAVADNGVIGRDGTLPWHLPDDLKHFRALTWGKPVLMGRRTFASIGKPLAGRRNLVLSRADAGAVFGAEVFASFDAAVGAVADAAELCVIGGAEVFALALPRATRAYLTRVHASIAGDVLFPLSELAGWREIARQEHAVDDRHAFPLSFITLARGAGIGAIG